MDFRNILVALEPGVSPATLSTAVDLARRFRARLTGFAAAEPSAVLLEGPGGIDSYRAARSQIEEALLLAKSDFDARVPHDLLRSWDSEVGNPTWGLRRKAVGSDLIVVERHVGVLDPTRRPDIGDLVLTCGRPILALGTGGSSVKGGRVVVAWKDSREARRAVADALPFLRGADQVLVATVDEGDYASERSQMDQVIAWLQLHEIAARGEVLPMGPTLASTIHTAASAIEADLIVAGGYGHSRFREWLLGGMTQELLENPDVGLLLSN